MAGLYNHAGLKISNTKLQLVEIFSDPSQVRLENLNEVVFAEQIDFKNDKAVKILAQLQSAFDEIRINKPLKSSMLSFALSLELFYVVHLPFEKTLLRQDAEAEFKWEYSILFPFVNTDELIIQYQEVEKNNIFQHETALVYGIERKYLKLLKNFCEKNNLKLGYIDNVHLSAERALKTCSDFLERGLRLSVYLSKCSFSMILTLDDKLLYQKIFKPVKPAEAGKLVRNELNNLNLRKELIQGAYVSGDVPIESYIGELNFYSGMNFTIFNPFDKITPGPGIKNSPLFLQRYNTFSSAAGIAYRIS